MRKYAGEQERVWEYNQCDHKWVNKYIKSSGGKGYKQDTNVGSWFEEETKTCHIYGAWRGAFGLEPTPEMYVDHTITFLQAIRRVLRKDGVVFWNIGDSYAGSNKGAGDTFDPNGKQETVRGCMGMPTYKLPNGLKAKDLCLIPFRVALAAQADGWWVRSVIIWNKPNPMPESVSDRPTDSYEFILMLTKSADYYWDQEAVREPAQSWGTRDRSNMRGSTDDPLLKHHGLENDTNPNGRNLRNVWTFPTVGYPGAHFATFPEELPERCIKAATPEVGCCAKCGKPWERIVERNSVNRTRFSGIGQDSSLGTVGRAGGIESLTLGWQPTCKCGTDEKRPSVALDPFAGSGTTLWVAKKMGRKAIGIEISEEYCAMAADRCRQQVMM